MGARDSALTVVSAMEQTATGVLFEHYRGLCCQHSRWRRSGRNAAFLFGSGLRSSGGSAVACAGDFCPSRSEPGAPHGVPHVVGVLLQASALLGGPGLCRPIRQPPCTDVGHLSGDLSVGRASWQAASQAQFASGPRKQPGSSQEPPAALRSIGIRAAQRTGFHPQCHRWLGTSGVAACLRARLAPSISGLRLPSLWAPCASRRCLALHAACMAGLHSHLGMCQVLAFLSYVRLLCGVASRSQLGRGMSVFKNNFRTTPSRPSSWTVAGAWAAAVPGAEAIPGAAAIPWRRQPCGLAGGGGRMGGGDPMGCADPTGCGHSIVAAAFFQRMRRYNESRSTCRSIGLCSVAPAEATQPFYHTGF